MSDLLAEVRDRLTGAAHTRQQRGDNLPHSRALAVERSIQTRTSTLRPLSTKWRAILCLELRGLNKREIADQLRASYGSVVNITTSARYIEHREHTLGIADQDFFNLKPLAVKALSQGLLSTDENVALRASDQWFTVAGYGARRGGIANAPTLTAEAVVAQIFSNATINVQNNSVHVHPDRADDDRHIANDTSGHTASRTSRHTSPATSIEPAESRVDRSATRGADPSSAEE